MESNGSFPFGESTVECVLPLAGKGPTVFAFGKRQRQRKELWVEFSKVPKYHFQK